MKELDMLSEEDRNLLYQVPVLITFLIAGSDNNIDDQERDWAQRLIEFRSMRNESNLVSYYLDVEKNWEGNFQKFAAALVDYDDADLRSHFISSELNRVNPVLTKLPGSLSEMLYKSFRSFAEQIARASGGVFGFGAVSPEEQRWLHLPMIENPVEHR